MFGRNLFEEEDWQGDRELNGKISCKILWREEVWLRKLPLIEVIGEGESGNQPLKVGKNDEKEED